jgi:hypothetical protein
MYILIFEDGTIAKTESLSEALLSNAADGYVDVVDVSNLTIYTPESEWIEIADDIVYDEAKEV